MQARWKGAAALAAIGAVGAALGLRARSAKRKDMTKLPPSSGGGTSTAGPLRNTAAADAPIVSEVAEHDTPTPEEEAPRYPSLSDDFRALSTGKKILAYFGFLDVEVFKNSAPLFPEETEGAEIFAP